MNTLTLKNPHSVLAVLETRPKDVERITLPVENPKAQISESDAPWEEVRKLAQKNRVKIEVLQSDQDRRNPKARPFESGRTTRTEAQVKDRAPVSIYDLFEGVREDRPGLWLALDTLQDPQNVGAIFRTAAFFGVRGIIMTSDRSAGMTASVYDIASGGVEYVPFCIEANLVRALKLAKEKGLWILGTSEHSKESYSKHRLDRNWLLVLGNEEKGMRRLTEENCDVICKIPAQGKVTSLNVANAASILISKLTFLG